MGQQHQALLLVILKKAGSEMGPAFFYEALSLEFWSLMLIFGIGLRWEFVCLITRAFYKIIDASVNEKGGYFHGNGS